MDLHDIVRLEEVFSIERANKLLEKGWVLLHIFKYVAMYKDVNDGSDNPDEQTRFILGWSARNGEPVL